MALLNNVKPYKQIGPGAHIKELMDIRDWTQKDLADVLGVSTKHVNKLLNDEQPITLNMAKLLSEAFDMSPQFWINLDTNGLRSLKIPKTLKKKFVNFGGWIRSILNIWPTHHN